jgi:hypothetical protein
MLQLAPTGTVPGHAVSRGETIAFRRCDHRNGCETREHRIPMPRDASPPTRSITTISVELASTRMFSASMVVHSPSNGMNEHLSTIKPIKRIVTRQSRMTSATLRHDLILQPLDSHPPTHHHPT